MPPDIAGVSALSSGDVWAVGPAPYPENPQSPVIVHWNGRRLELIRPLGSRADPAAGLSGIAAVSADDVWAVGMNYGQPLVVHWDGTRWRIVRTPQFRRSAELYGIVALTRTNVWAVGSVGDPGKGKPLVMHWTGRAWNVVVIPGSGALYAVAAAGPRDLWAMGDDNGDGGSITLVDSLALHWDSRRWRGFPTPHPDDEDLGYEGTDQFTGVDAVSATESWAVHSGVASSDVQRWNGRDWRISVRFRNKYLGAVAAVSRRNVWAVGGWSRPLIVHWDGRRWTNATPAPLRRRKASLEAISAVSARNIWAAGPRLLARYSC
jgi:hypothetical protein